MKIHLKNTKNKRTNTWCIALILLWGMHLPAQSQNKTFKKGQQAFQKRAYAKAASHFQKSLDRRFSKIALLNLADSQRLARQFSQAAKTYEKLVSLSTVNPKEHFHYGEVLMHLSFYQKAQNQFQKYSELQPDDPRGKALAASCGAIHQYYTDTASYRCTPFPLNSAANDGPLCFHPQGLIFASARPKATHSRTLPGATDLFLLHLTDTVTKKAAISQLQTPNSPLSESPGCYLNSELGFAFTRSTDPYSLALPQPGQQAPLAIFFLTQPEGKEPKIKPFAYNSPAYSVAHPTCSPDGQTIYFASDMPGSIGRLDLFRVERTDQGWSQPQNLGSAINTPGNESHPWIAPDGTLYFSTDGLGGLGGLDIWESKPGPDGFGTPRNIGAPFNSGFHDFSYCRHPETGNTWLTSDRNQDSGMDLFIVEEIKHQERLSTVAQKSTDSAATAPTVKPAPEKSPQQEKKPEQEKHTQQAQNTAQEENLSEQANRALNKLLDTIPAPPSPALDIHFIVQIGVFYHPVSEDFFNNLGELRSSVMLRRVGKMFKYALGPHDSQQEATAQMRVLQRKGYPDAFIVAISDGKRIPLKEATRLLENEEQKK